VDIIVIRSRKVVGESPHQRTQKRDAEKQKIRRQHNERRDYRNNKICSFHIPPTVS
jgi:hypothetical protein